MVKFDPAKPLDVIAMGRASVDFVPDSYGPTTENHHYTKFLGGSPANTAVALAQQGMRVGYIGKVGQDILGDYLLDYMKKKKIDTSHIVVHKDPNVRTGFSVAELMAPNQKRSNLYRVGAADLDISMDEIDESYIASAKLLIFSGTSLSNTPARESVFIALEYARRNGVVVAFDPDYRAQSWNTVEEASIYYWLAMQKSDILIATREEMNVVEGLFCNGIHDDDKSARRCLEQGVQIVIIKHGEEGSCGWTSDGTMHRQGLFPSRVISLQGAGDSYSGSFFSRLILGDMLENAMKFAAASAALTVSGRSCSEHMPSRAMTERFISLCDAGRSDEWVFWE